MADNFAEARRTQQQATQSLDEVRAGKARAEATPLGQDTSALNAKKAEREGWSRTGDSRLSSDD